MAVAVCAKCRRELPAVGVRCENDGWFAVAPEELSADNTFVGRPLGGSFVALKKIGQGGMGSVYSGRQIQFERVVAIKILSSIHLSNDQVVARFEREAKSVARVTHPNVVQLIDSGIENGIAYIVMEYVKGRELSNIPASELTIQFILHVTDQVLNALAEAHAANVIHRDLKPDNIMITEEDGDPAFAKLLDFGLATLNDTKRITASGQALGTPWYMSPEQATASDVTAASDIYSLGCILYELVTSKPPFPGNRPYNVMMQHVNAPVPPIVCRPELVISSQLNAFIIKCLEKEPSDRYTTAKEALAALHALPEWFSVSQNVVSQSIQISMKQLSELSKRSSSDAISDISAVLSRAEVNGELGISIAPSSSNNPVVQAPMAQNQPMQDYSSRDDEVDFEALESMETVPSIRAVPLPHKEGSNTLVIVLIVCAVIVIIALVVIILMLFDVI